MESKKRLTIQEIKLQLEALNYTIIENTYNQKTYMFDCKCPKNHITTVHYYRFMVNKNKCKLCPQIIDKGKKIDINFLKEEFKKYNCELLSETYINYNIPLEYKCSKKHLTKMSYHIWKNNKYKCKDCGREEAGKKQKLSYDFVKSKFEERKYKLLSTEYTNKEKNLEFECPNNHKGSMTFNNFYYSKSICVECAGSKKHSIESIRDILQKDGYKLISNEYKDNKGKLKKECNNGHLIDLRLNDFVTGYRCRYCVETIGEKKISAYLKNSNHNLIFDTEFKFDNCKNIKQLPFDFYVNKQFLIEYDGEQHFKSVDFFGGEEGYKARQINDKIKTKFCKDNKIPLLRISFNQIDNIPDIIEKFIENLKTNNNLIHFTDDKLYDYLK